jgi:hypothetical protein
MKSQHPPNKTSVEGMYNSVEQVENGVSWMQDNEKY